MTPTTTRSAVPDPGEMGVFAAPSSLRLPWGQAADARVDISTLPDDIVLSVRDLTVAYRVRRGTVKAVRKVSFDLQFHAYFFFALARGCKYLVSQVGTEPRAYLL